MNGRRHPILSAGLVLILIAALLLLTSCGARKAGYDQAASPSAFLPQQEDYNESVSDFEGGREIAGSGGESAVPRYRIRTGSLELTVPVTRETVAEVTKIADGAGGYVSDSYIYTVKEDLYHANLTLRVPENRFDAVMEQLQGLGKFTDVRTGDDDVTMSYLDMEARLETLEAQEVRLRELLGRAETVADLLDVERELQRVRLEIESLSTQFKYLQDQVRLATITVGIREEQISTTTVTPAPFANLGARMKTGLVRSINFILSAIAGIAIVLVALLPVAVILGLAALVLRFIISRFGRRRRGPTPPPANNGS